MNKIAYNTNQFPFSEKLQQLFKVKDLSSISDDIEIFTREKDQSTKWHKLYYEWARTEGFTKLYEQFILEVIKIKRNQKITKNFFLK